MFCSIVTEVSVKLLNCKICHDVQKIRKSTRVCACGKSSARYIDPRWVEYQGPAQILGILNSEYTGATPEQNYRWFVIPEGHHIRKIEGKPDVPTKEKEVTQIDKEDPHGAKT